MRKFSVLPAISPRIGRLDASGRDGARAHSKLCGSTVTVDLKMDDGVVTDFAHDVKACALGQASSSIMARACRRRERRRIAGGARDDAEDAEGKRRAAGRPLRRPEISGAGARLQGAPCLDHADLRRRGRRASARSRSKQRERRPRRRERPEAAKPILATSRTVAPTPGRLFGTGARAPLSADTFTLRRTFAASPDLLGIRLRGDRPSRALRGGWLAAFRVLGAGLWVRTGST